MIDSMVATLLVFLAAVFVFGLVSQRLQRTWLTGPMVFTAVGLACGAAISSQSRFEARVAVADAVKGADVDPVFGQMNKSLVKAHTQLAASKAADDDAWVTLQDSSDALETIRTGIDSAWSTLDTL